VTIFIHPIASCLFWRSAAWHIDRTAFGTVLSTVNILFIRLLPAFSGDLPPGMSPGQPSERSCRQILFLFIRLLPALSGDLPPGISGGLLLERSCRQLFFLFIRCAMMMTLMSSLRPFVRKSKEDYVRKNKADYAGKNDGETTETRKKRTCMDKKKYRSRKWEKQTTLDTTEAKKTSATTGHRSCSPSSAWSSRPCQRGGSYETRFKQTDRSK